MKKRSIILILLIVLMAALAALFANNSFNVREEKRNVDIQNGTIEHSMMKYKTIGLVAGNMQDKSIANIFSILKDYSKENENIRMMLYDSEAKADKQVLQLEEFISMKVDGIILSPVENLYPESVLSKLKQSGIPTVLVNSDTANSNFACAIGFSSIEIGKAQAEYMADKLNGHGNLLIFSESDSNSSSVKRLAGFNSVINHYPRIETEIVQVVQGDMKKTLASLPLPLNRGKKIDGIVLQQNDLSLQVQPLLDALDDTPVVIGVDTAPELLSLLKDRRIDASVYISSSDMAVGAYDVMMKIIKREPVPSEKIIPYTLITAENIDEYIENNLNYKIK